MMATHSEPILEEAANIIAKVLRDGAPDFGFDLTER